MRAYLFSCLVAIFLVVFSAQNIFAQNLGPPIFKRISIYTAAGGVAGAAASTVYWLTDPLSPDRTFRSEFIVGFGIGALLGFFLGIHQAFVSTVNPNTVVDLESNLYPDYYLLSFDQFPADNSQHSLNSIIPGQQKPLEIFNFSYRF